MIVYIHSPEVLRTRWKSHHRTRNVSSEKSNLKRHIQSKHELVEYTCTECDRRFSQKSDLERHIQSVHKKMKYTYKECNKQFSLKSHLEIHVLSVHEGVKYTCTECDKQFSEGSGLVRHIQSIHEQVKYTCTECDKQFSEKSHLKRHIQSIHAYICCFACYVKVWYFTVLHAHISWITLLPFLLWYLLICMIYCFTVTVLLCVKCLNYFVTLIYVIDIFVILYACLWLWHIIRIILCLELNIIYSTFIILFCLIILLVILVLYLHFCNLLWN